MSATVEAIEAAGDLRRAAEYYRERAGNGLSQALLDEFERSTDLLLQFPRLGSLWRSGTRRSDEALPSFDHLQGRRRRNSNSGSCSP
jgi:plasmid stabilization system protein ParE